MSVIELTKHEVGIILQQPVQRRKIIRFRRLLQMAINVLNILVLIALSVFLSTKVTAISYHTAE